MGRLAAAILTLLVGLGIAAPARADVPLVWTESLPLAHHYGVTGPYTLNALLSGEVVLIPIDHSDDLELVGLHYTNSFYIPTNVVGLSWTPLQLGPLRIGGMLGVSNKNAYPYSPVKPIIAAGEVNVILGPRTRLNVDVMPCGGGAWCKAAVAFGLQQAFGKR